MNSQRYIYWSDKRARYIVRGRNGFYVGSYETEEEATRARDVYVVSLKPALVCDYCGQRCHRHVVVLWKAPKQTRTKFSHYTATAAIGPCCVMKVNEIEWRRRRSVQTA